MPDLRDLLRSLPAIVGDPPPWDPQGAPEDPRALFIDWLHEAIERGVAEPHAATLSTVDTNGRPDARVLIVKNVTASGEFEIATMSTSAKGRQLAAHPPCALTFYWSPLARSVRVRGVAGPASPQDSARDFLARHPDSRALVFASAAGGESASDKEHRRLVGEAKARIERDPDLVSRDWVVWRIRPDSVEFWQGSEDRDHQRLRYLRSGKGWSRERLRA